MPAAAAKSRAGSDDFVDEAIAEVRREMASSDREAAFLTAEIMRAIGLLAQVTKPLWNDGAGVGPLALAVALTFHNGLTRDQLDAPLQATVESLTERFRDLAVRYGGGNVPPSPDSN